jgi:glycerol uptake facilitator-like aquaporin
MSTLRQRLIAEAIGTAALLTIIVGSGIMASRLAGGNSAVALLANSLATGCGLFVLISVLGPISGAHFNPLVSAIAALEGTLNRAQFLTYVTVQFVAAVGGVWIAHAMFGLGIVELGTRQRTGFSQCFSEFVATSGLVLIVLGSKHRALPWTAALIAAYICAAYWFTASTSFANPAVTFARALTDTFTGIRPLDSIAFVVAQVAGAATAVMIARELFGQRSAVPLAAPASAND